MYFNFLKQLLVSNDYFKHLIKKFTQFSVITVKLAINHLLMICGTLIK